MVRASGFSCIKFLYTWYIVIVFVVVVVVGGGGGGFVVFVMDAAASMFHINSLVISLFFYLDPVPTKILKVDSDIEENEQVVPITNIQETVTAAIPASTPEVTRPPNQRRISRLLVISADELAAAAAEDTPPPPLPPLGIISEVNNPPSTESAEEDANARLSNSETSTMLGLRDTLGLRRRRLITSLHSRPSFREREAHQRVHMRRVGGRSRSSR